MNVASSNTPEAGIFNFHSELLKLLGRGHISLLALQEMDFPGGFQHTQTESLKLQQSLQKAIVDATTGTGESDTVQLGTWFTQHQADLDKLKGY